MQRSFVGDNLEDCVLTLCTDSDFAADHDDPKSTSGIALCIRGPHTFVPLTFISKKQGAVSHSTTEAEMIALELALRQELLPFLDLWEAVLQMYHIGAGEQAVGKPLPASADTVAPVVEPPPIELWQIQRQCLRSLSNAIPGSCLMCIALIGSIWRGVPTC